jgi:hypothetical protein
VSGFLLAHLQRQVYKFGSGSSLLGTVSAPGLIENSKHVRQKQIDKLIKILHIALVVIQFHSKMHGSYNIKFSVTVIHQSFGET